MTIIYNFCLFMCGFIDFWRKKMIFTELSFIFKSINPHIYSIKRQYMFYFMFWIKKRLQCLRFNIHWQQMSRYLFKNWEFNQKCSKSRLWRAFLSCFTASANEFDISRQCTYIMFILQYQKAQNNCQIVQRKQKQASLLLCLLWNPRLYCYRFVSSLNMKYQKLFILVRDCI